MNTKYYEPAKEHEFYCEFKKGGCEYIDPVYMLEEDEHSIHVWGGYMGPEPYIYSKEDLSSWEVRIIK